MVVPLIDPLTIFARAAQARRRAGYIDADPPYSTRRLVDAWWYDVHVAGAELADGVTEMAQTDGQHYAVWYNRRVPHPVQRVGIVHGLHHFLTDLRDVPQRELRECNLPLRQLERAGYWQNDPIERACDLFAGEVLVPFDQLNARAPRDLFPRSPADKQAWDDLVDGLASTFNVPVGFIRWRLYDLIHLRRTHFFTGK